MDGGACTVMTGPTPTLAGGRRVARPLRRVADKEGQWPGTRPWPLFSALGPIGALPTAPGLARKFTAMVLGGWEMGGVHDLREVSELIISELATNVVRVATGGDGCPIYQVDGRLTEMWLRLMSDRALLRVEVWDNLPASAGVPAVCHPKEEEEHGRGLALVERLSHSWGWDQIPGVQAKTVWVLFKAR